MSYTFVHETANNQAKRFVALLIIILLAATCVTVVAVDFFRAKGTANTDSFFVRYTPDVIHNITPAKQFVFGVLAGLIFVPIPVSIELTNYLGLQQGNPLLLSMGAAILGLVIGLAITYILGWKLSKQVSYLLSTKHMYAIRRKVNKYGVYAILVMYFLPVPGGDLLAFSLGVANYNAKRLFFFMVLALTVKLIVIAVAFHYIH